MCACVYCVCCRRLHILNARVRQRERAFEEGDEKEEDTGAAGGKKEEKMKMREMEGLGRRRRDCPVAWLVLKSRGLDHPYQMHGLRSQDHEGWREAEATAKQLPPLVSPQLADG